MKTTNNFVPDETTQEAQEDEEEDSYVETKETEQLASFDEVMVWGHEAMPASDDAYSKGLGEWVSFAEAVSCAPLFMFIIPVNLRVFQMHSTADEKEDVANSGKST